MRCSREVSTPCRCDADAPAVGTAAYGTLRSHPDAGDLEALGIVTGWLRDRIPCLHLRFADGEFWSILGRSGANADGAKFDSDSLGLALENVLLEAQFGIPVPALIGGDWTVPEHEAYVRRKNLLRTIPWCPSSIWVNGIVSGALAEFFRVLTVDPRPRILVANSSICEAGRFLRATQIQIPATDAWSQRDAVGDLVDHLPAEAVVMYCAGMASEVFAWDALKVRTDLTHLDMGHIFDGAFGVRSRAWLQPEGECRKRDVYFERYAPAIRGERELA